MGRQTGIFCLNFLKVSTTYQRTPNALARLRLCVGSPEPLLVAYVRWTSLIGATNRHILPEISQSLYYISANSKGSVETTLMRRLAWAFVGRLCNRNLPYWGDKQAYFSELSQSLYYISANSKGAGEPTLMCRLAWAFVGRPCDMNLPYWGDKQAYFSELSQSLYYISANSKGAGEPTLMRRLAWAFVGRPCDMNLPYWGDKQAYFAWTFTKSLLHISEQQRH